MVQKGGLLYLPVSMQGFLICVILLAFCVHIFISVGSKVHSVSDMLYGTFPYVAPAFLCYLWIASETTGKKQN